MNTQPIVFFSALVLLFLKISFVSTHLVYYTYIKFIDMNEKERVGQEKNTEKNLNYWK